MFNSLRDFILSNRHFYKSKFGTVNAVQFFRHLSLIFRAYCSCWSYSCMIFLQFAKPQWQKSQCSHTPSYLLLFNERKQQFLICRFWVTFPHNLNSSFLCQNNGFLSPSLSLLSIKKLETKILEHLDKDFNFSSYLLD